MPRTFSVPAFLAFCREMPAGEEYPWHPRKCPLAQFGFPGVIGPDDCEAHGIPVTAFRAAALLGPQTWGALATRLSKIP